MQSLLTKKQQQHETISNYLSKDSLESCGQFVKTQGFGFSKFQLYERTTFLTSRSPALGQVNLMEKSNNQKRKVELTRTFNEAWQNLCGRTLELKTSEDTPFVAKARLARRRGSLVKEEVLVFLKNYRNGKLKECSRCYSEDWGHYFNNFGKEGQRVGMYCRAVDLLRY